MLKKGTNETEPKAHLSSRSQSEEPKFYNVTQGLNSIHYLFTECLLRGVGLSKRQAQKGVKTASPRDARRPAEAEKIAKLPTRGEGRLHGAGRGGTEAISPV